MYYIGIWPDGIIVKLSARSNPDLDQFMIVIKVETTDEEGEDDHKISLDRFPWGK